VGLFPMDMPLECFDDTTQGMVTPGWSYPGDHVRPVPRAARAGSLPQWHSCLTFSLVCMATVVPEVFYYLNVAIRFSITTVIFPEGRRK
jgi:hypothetical protein